jgi:hypothetical protein
VFRIAVPAAILCALLSLGLVLRADAQGDGASEARQSHRLVNSIACLYCHREGSSLKGDSEKLNFELYDGGAHAAVACVDCHVEFTLSPHRLTEGGVTSMAIRCHVCHERQSSDYEAGVHAAAGVGCIECHSTHYPPRIIEMDPGTRSEFVVSVCLRCHSTSQEDAASVIFNDMHARRLGAGDVRVPACNVCHGSHDTKSYTKPPYNTPRARRGVCTPCHPDIDPGIVAAYSHEPMHKSFPAIHFIIVLMIGLLVLEGGQMTAFLVLDLRRHAINLARQDRPHHDVGEIADKDAVEAAIASDAPGGAAEEKRADDADAVDEEMHE